MNDKEKLIRGLVECLSEESLEALKAMFHKPDDRTLQRVEADAKYWYINSLGDTCRLEESRALVDYKCFNHHNYSYSEESAERRAKIQKCNNHLFELAEKLNEGWKPDWEDEQEHKYHIYCYEGLLRVSGSEVVLQQGTIYFKTKVAAELALRQLDEEDKAVLRGEV